MQQKPNHTVQALLLGLAAFFVWACNDTATKYVGKMEVPFPQMIVLAGIGAVILLTLSALLKGDIRRLQPKNMKVIGWQCVLTIIIGYVGVATFTQLPLTTVYTALFSSPLIVAVLAKIFLKEKLGRKQYLYIFIGFVGSLIAVNPFAADLKGGSALGWLLLPLYPVLFAVTMLISRSLRKSDTVESIAFLPTAVRMVFFSAFSFYDWQPVPIHQIVILMCAGASVALGNLLFNSALTKADSSVIAPLHYSQIIYGAFFGYVIWSDIPTWNAIAGSIIIVTSGLAGAKLASRKEIIQEEKATLLSTIH